MGRRRIAMLVVGLGTAALIMGIGGSPALALSFTGNYFVLSNTHPDTSINPAEIDDVKVTGLVGLALNGPAATATSAPNYTGLVPASGPIGDTVGAPAKIQWWTVHSTGLNVVTADSVAVKSDAFVAGVLGGPGFATNFFPTGSVSDAGGYRAVHWTGAFEVVTSASLSLTADDDAWLFLNGALSLDNGGVKPLGAATTSSTVLGPGEYLVDLFFADRHITQSGLEFKCEGCLDPVLDPVPEPATLLLFGTTLAGLGVVVRRRMKREV